MEGQSLRFEFLSRVNRRLGLDIIGGQRLPHLWRNGLSSIYGRRIRGR